MLPQRKMITFESVEDEDESTSSETADVELPEGQQVQMKPKEDISTTLSGIKFQRCGGGRRIIKRGRSV